MEILKKETFNNWYTLRTFFCANMLITTPIHVIFCKAKKKNPFETNTLNFNFRLSCQRCLRQLYSLWLVNLFIFSLNFYRWNNFNLIFRLWPDQLFEVDRFLKFTLILILVTIVADGLGLILGSVFTPVVRIITFRKFSLSLCISWKFHQFSHFPRMGYLLAQQHQPLYLPLVDSLLFTAKYRSRWDFYRICHRWVICLKQSCWHCTMIIEPIWFVLKRRCIATTSMIHR